MSLPIIQSLWIGGSLSKIEQLSISSFLNNNHEFHLYVYDDVQNIPEGTVVKDANEILPKKNIFTYNNGSYAGFADWFRWELLYLKGGFWVDTDVICIKPFDFVDDIIYGAESVDLVCPAVLGFPPKHEMCKFLANNCKNPNDILPYDTESDKKRKLKRRRKFWQNQREHIEWGESGGPEGFTKALNYFGMRDLAKPFTYFYPIHFSNWHTFYDKTFVNNKNLFEDTYAVHLWNEMSRRASFDKNDTFDLDSLVEYYKSIYF